MIIRNMIWIRNITPEFFFKILGYCNLAVRVGDILVAVDGTVSVRASLCLCVSLCVLVCACVCLNLRLIGVCVCVHVCCPTVPGD
jgi:hypothetical protein